MAFWQSLFSTIFGQNKSITVAERFSTTGYLNMQLLLKRLDSTDYGIFGHLEFVDKSLSLFNCVTLENSKLEISPGTYKIVLDKSPHLGYVTPHLIVPDRDAKAGGDAGIRIHKGNWQYQSEGCLLLGRERDGNAVDASGDAFEELMEILHKADDISIRIV